MTYQEMTFAQLVSELDKLKDANQKLSSQLDEYKEAYGDLSNPKEFINDYEDNMPTVEDLSTYEALYLATDAQELTESQKQHYYYQENSRIYGQDESC